MNVAAKKPMTKKNPTRSPKAKKPAEKPAKFPRSALSSTPFEVQRGQQSFERSILDDTLYIEDTVVGSNRRGEFSSVDSNMAIHATFDPDGKSSIQFDDMDNYRNLKASITQDRKGRGLLTIDNPSPFVSPYTNKDGFLSRVTYPLGDVSQSVVKYINRWGDGLHHLSVFKGEGNDDLILLGIEEVYLDGRQNLGQSDW